MILICLFLLLCQPNQTDAQQVIQRLNYGIIFTQESTVHIEAEEWLHTFQVTIPRKVNVPHLGTSLKDNNTCLLVGQLLSQINSLRTETALLLSNTIETIHQPVPHTTIQKSRSSRSLLPFLGQFSKTLFGTATMDDINT